MHAAVTNNHPLQVCHYLGWCGSQPPPPPPECTSQFGLPQRLFQVCGLLDPILNNILELYFFQAFTIHESNNRCVPNKCSRHNPCGASRKGP